MARAPWLLVGLAAGLGGCVEYDGSKAPRWELLGAGAGPREIDIEGSPPDLPPEPRSFKLAAEFPLPPELQGRPLWLAAPSRAPLQLLIDGEAFEPLERSIFERFMGTAHGRCFAVPARLTRRTSLPVTLNVTRTVFPRQQFKPAPRLSAEPGCNRGFQILQTHEQLFWPITFAIFAVLMVVHAASFASDRQRKVEAWFALMMAALAGESIERLGVFQPLGIEWAVPVMGALQLFEEVSLAFFFYALLERRSPPAWLLVLQVLLGLATVLTYPDPRLSSPFSSVADALAYVVTFGVISWLAVRNARSGERRAEAMTVLLSWWFVGLLWFHIVLFLAFVAPKNVATVFHARPLSIVLLSVAYTILLALDRTRALRSLNDQLASRVEQLEGRNREVASLNDDLRHQLRARSRALSDKLIQAGAPTVDLNEFAPGSVIGGRYRVLGRLGAGGMGSVFTVEHTDGRRLALKVLHRARSGAELARLAREAELVATVTHPRLVGIIDVDVSASGQLYIVMEHVEGRPLSSAHDRYGDIPWALSVLRQIAEGLDALHQAGVVHRDIKPDNVLLTGRGGVFSIKIVDFGIAFRVHSQDSAVDALSSRPPSRPPGPSFRGAVEVGALTASAVPFNRPGKTVLLPEPMPPVPSAVPQPPAPSWPPGAAGGPPPTPLHGLSPAEGLNLASARSSLTMPGQILGTPDYMAPELAWGSDRATAASDLWSLGVLAHVLLARSKPFEDPPLMTAICGLPCPAAPPLASRVPGLDPALGALLDRCLAPDPSLRPPARAFAASLPP